MGGPGYFAYIYIYIYISVSNLAQDKLAQACTSLHLTMHFIMGTAGTTVAPPCDWHWQQAQIHHVEAQDSEFPLHQGVAGADGEYLALAEGWIRVRSRSNPEDVYFASATPQRTTFDLREVIPTLPVNGADVGTWFANQNFFPRHWQPLPPGWIRLVSKTSSEHRSGGKVYFFNFENGATTWTFPEAPLSAAAAAPASEPSVQSEREVAMPVEAEVEAVPEQVEAGVELVVGSFSSPPVCGPDATLEQAEGPEPKRTKTGNTPLLASKLTTANATTKTRSHLAKLKADVLQMMSHKDLAYPLMETFFSGWAAYHRANFAIRAGNKSDAKVSFEILGKLSYKASSHGASVQDVALLELQASDEVLDLGANVGLFMIWAHVVVGVTQFTLVEPSQESLPLLRHNVNQARSRGCDCKIVECAIGAEAGTDVLDEHSHTAGGASRTRLKRFEKYTRPHIVKNIKEVDVAVRTLGMLLTSTCSFVKMDVEGADLEVLAELRD